MLNEDARTTLKIVVSKPVRNKIAPIRIPMPWKPANATETQVAVAYEVLKVSDAELRVALKRSAILKQLKEGLIDRTKAIELLGIKKSQFYNLYNKFLESDSFLEMARKKRGTRPGNQKITPRQLSALEESYQENYKGPNASSAKVWKGAQGLCAGEQPPSKYQCRKFISAKPEKDKFYRKHGKEAGDNKYKSKPGRKIMERVLQQVQMDHTRVDMMLVDEFDRSVVVGRPWLTMIMCALTRIILGFYLSFRPPSLRTVAHTLSFAVLDKFQHLESYLHDDRVYPFHGKPYLIYTDNASEFTSPRLIATCKRWGMDWDHRPVDKTWYGGLIERCIGTFMGEIHFLPGNTGSNVLQRAGQTPELDAKYSIIDCAKFLLDQVVIYHGTVHDEIKCTPRQAWNYYNSQGLLDHDRVVLPDERKLFEIDFLPPSYNHTIQVYGVNFAGRRYHSYELDRYIGSKNVEVRYQPNNLDSIWVLVSGRFLCIPCTFTRDRMSRNWESYTSHKALSSARHVGHSAPSGLLDDEYAVVALQRQRLLANEVAAKPRTTQKTPKDVTENSERLPNRPTIEPVIGAPRIIGNSGDGAGTMHPKIIVDRFRE